LGRPGRPGCARFRPPREDWGNSTSRPRRHKLYFGFLRIDGAAETTHTTAQAVAGTVPTGSGARSGPAG